tara:strand:- start:2001 stop:2522 length:522 start_codon:yes stop_codon:yes gene_type:complete
MTKLVALEPMELKTTMPENVTTGGKRKTKGRKSMKKGMKKSMKKGMKKSMKKGMKMKRKTHKKKYLKKKKGGDEGDNSDKSVDTENTVDTGETEETVDTGDSMVSEEQTKIDESLIPFSAAYVKANRKKKGKRYKKNHSERNYVHPLGDNPNEKIDQIYKDQENLYNIQKGNY